MRYRVQRGCPKCGGVMIREITREKYELLTDREGEDGVIYYRCCDEKCFWVWSVERAEPVFDGKKVDPRLKTSGMTA